MAERLELRLALAFNPNLSLYSRRISGGFTESLATKQIEMLHTHQLYGVLYERIMRFFDENIEVALIDPSPYVRRWGKEYLEWPKRC